MKTKYILSVLAFAACATMGVSVFGKARPTGNFSQLFLPLVYATSDDDRLVLIKNVYYMINGGPDGTWPDGPTASWTGYNAPSDRLEGGAFGVINDLIGPNGDVSNFLAAQGYTSCSSLPSSSTTFQVTDSQAGVLDVTVSASTRAIPSGFTNSGNFEKRVLIEQSGTPMVVIHLHCSTSVLTMLVRANMDLEVDGETENVEAITEGSQNGPDISLQYISQKTGANQRDLAFWFNTVDGINYEMGVAYSSGKTDAGGNGPSHVLAAIHGNTSTKLAQVNAMGGNADISATSSSAEYSTLPFDAAQKPNQFATGNQFCYNLTTRTTTTGCSSVSDPGTPAISGLSAWTMTGIYNVGQGTSNVSDISTY